MRNQPKFELRNCGIRVEEFIELSESISGTLLLASAQTDDTDLLWLLSSEGFPFQSALMEGQSTICLDGRAWALAEVPAPRRLLRLYAESFGSRQPPLAVVQHAQIARYIWINFLPFPTNWRTPLACWPQCDLLLANISIF